MEKYKRKEILEQSVKFLFFYVIYLLFESKKLEKLSNIL